MQPTSHVMESSTGTSSTLVDISTTPNPNNPFDRNQPLNPTREQPFGSAKVDSTFSKLLRLQQTAGSVTQPHSGVSNDGLSMTTSQVELSEPDVVTDSPHKQVEGNNVTVTNYISISRKATPHPLIFKLFYPDPKIKDTFYVDPHLRVPSAVLSAVSASNKSTGPGTRNNRAGGYRKNRNRKNLKLELEDGAMDVGIHLIPDNDAVSSSRFRKIASSASLMTNSNDGTGHSRNGRVAIGPKDRTTMVASLVTSRSTRFKAYPLLMRISAPLPRPPFHLTATCSFNTPVPNDLPTDPPIPTPRPSYSPLTLFLPRSFRGPVTVHVQSGNIDQHISLSPSISAIARVMNEDANHRGYFLGRLPDEFDSLAGIEEYTGEGVGTNGIMGRERNNNDEDEEWAGDKVELSVEDGRIRILLEDEELEGWARMSSNGWMWPRQWS